jgi:hypothetical protein
MKKKPAIKTKQSKTAKQSKKSVKRKPSVKTTIHGVKVGDRVHCVYQGCSFRTQGTAVAIITVNCKDRVVVEHDYEVRRFLEGCWEEYPSIEVDGLSTFSVWGDNYVFKLT